MSSSSSSHVAQLPVLSEPHDLLRQGMPSAVSGLVAPAAPQRELPRLSVREMYGIGAALRVEQGALMLLFIVAQVVPSFCFCVLNAVVIANPCGCCLFVDAKLMENYHRLPG